MMRLWALLALSVAQQDGSSASAGLPSVGSYAHDVSSTINVHATTFDALQDCKRIWQDAREFTTLNRPRLLDSYFTGIPQHKKHKPQTLLIHIGKAAGTSLLNFYSKNDCFGMKLQEEDCALPVGPFGFNKDSKNRQCCAPFFTEVHALPASPLALAASPRIVITLRDPVERFISAFNTHACLRDAVGHKKRMMDCMRVPSNAPADVRPTAEMLQRLAMLHADADILGPDADVSSVTGLLAFTKSNHGLKCFPNVTYAADHIEDDSGCALEFRRRITAPATWVKGMETLEHVSRGTCFYVGGLFHELASSRVFALRSEHFEEDLRGLPAFLGVPVERVSFPAPQELNLHTGSFPHHEDKPTQEGRRRLGRLLVHEYAANSKIEQLSVNLGNRSYPINQQASRSGFIQGVRNIMHSELPNPSWARMAANATDAEEQGAAGDVTATDNAVPVGGGAQRAITEGQTVGMDLNMAKAAVDAARDQLTPEVESLPRPTGTGAPKTAAAFEDNMVPDMVPDFYRETKTSRATSKSRTVSFAAERPTTSRAAAAFDDRLQGAYSVALYGAKNRVDMASLKLVWFGLLGETERAIVVNAVGICSQHDRNRFLCGEGPRQLPVPLFTPQGLPEGRFGDPSGALYVDNPAPDEAVPSHSWVEIAHCPLAQHRKAFFGLRPDTMPAWAYVSPGSGVSVNVGNTAVIDEQAAFLAGFSRHGLSDAMAHLTTEEKRQQSKLLQWLGLNTREIALLDSVQRIGHQEHWSTQRVHEIIFFGGDLNEASNLMDIALAMPEKGVVSVMCGRYPNLFRCQPGSMPLAFMSNCSSSCEAPLPCENIEPCVAHGPQTDLGRRRLPIVTTLGFGEMSPPEGFQCGIPELRYTVRVDRDRVMQPRPLWVPKRPTPSLEGIYWTHFPKTSTEFARTLLSYACGPTTFDAEMDVSTYSGIKQPESCPRLSVHQQTLPHSPLGGPGAGEGTTPRVMWFHEWVPWQNDEPLASSVVSIFRDPAQRALSSFHYFYNKSKSNETCCGGGWGWDKHTRRKLKKRMAKAEPYAALQMFMKNAPPENCMTNMILGQGCMDNSEAARYVAASPKSRRRALEFVATGMAFVGILEKYDETVCLWHARFGEPLWTTEIQFNQDGSQLYDSSPYDSLKSSGKKSFDEILYHAALKRFETEVKANKQDIDECIAAIGRHRLDLQLALEKRKQTVMFKANSYAQGPLVPDRQTEDEQKYVVPKLHL